MSRLPLPRPTRAVVVAMAVLLLLAAGCFWYAEVAAAGPKAEQRLAAWVGEKPPHWHLVTRVWLPRVAWVNGWLIVAAAMVLPWAQRPVRSLVADDLSAADDSGGLGRDGPRVRRWGWCGMVVLAGLAGWSTLPRLGQSVWGDEGRTLRECVVGQFFPGEDGALRFDEATWGDAFFHFRTPNNHVLYSVVARAWHEVWWRPRDGAGDAYFSEVALRLPAWLAGLAAVLGVARLGAVCGWRRAGWWAAAMLVLHPGFTRYAAEARGYAFLMALGPWLMVALMMAVRTGRWRWWLLAGACDFALMYTWPLSVHYVLVANGCALAAVVATGDRTGRERSVLGLRWGLTALAAAAVWAQLFVPCVIQLRYWLQGAGARVEAGGAGWVDALSLLMSGRVWAETDAANPLLMPWERMWPTQAWVVLLAGALILGGLLGGMVAGWRRTPALRGWLPVLVLPPAGIMAQAAFTGSVLYPWYIMIGVPGMMLALAIGLEAGATRLTRSAFGQTIVVASGIALWALIGAPVRHTLRHHPIEPNREAAWLVQPVINPYHPDYQKTVITAGFLMQNSIYDPGLREFKTVEELRALMEEAGRTGRDVAVTYGQPQLGRLVYPEIMAVLDDPAVFRPVAVLPGQEAYCTRHIVRHTPAAAR